MWPIPWCIWCYLPPPSLWTDACKNITFPKLRLRVVINVNFECNLYLVGDLCHSEVGLKFEAVRREAWGLRASSDTGVKENCVSGSCLSTGKQRVMSDRQIDRQTDRQIWATNLISACSNTVSLKYENRTSYSDTCRQKDTHAGYCYLSQTIFFLIFRTFRWIFKFKTGKI